MGFLLLAKCSWNGQEGNWFCLGTSSDRPLVTMMNGSLPRYPGYTIPRENFSTKGLNSSLFRWNVGFMIGGESHGLKFFLLIQSPKCCAWITHMSYVQGSTLEDHNGRRSPRCTWQSMSCTRPGICTWISSKQSIKSTLPSGIDKTKTLTVLSDRPSNICKCVLGIEVVLQSWIPAEKPHGVYRGEAKIKPG